MSEEHRTNGGMFSSWSLIAGGALLALVGAATTVIGSAILVVTWVQARVAEPIWNTVVPHWGIPDVVEGWLTVGIGVGVLAGAVALITRGLNSRFVPVEYGPRRSAEVPPQPR